MNEAEEALYAFKQALAQIVFYHLDELKRQFDEDDAVLLIGEELEKMQGMFPSENAPSPSLFSSLNDLEAKWQDKYKDAMQNGRYNDTLKAEDALAAIDTLKRMTED